MVQKIAAVALRKWRRGENKRFLVGLLLSAGSYEVKGNLPQKIVYGQRPKKHLKSKILVSKFLLWDLEATRT